MDALWNLLLSSGVAASEIESVKHLYLVVFLLPIVVTLIGIFRYVIGLRTLKIYIPIIMVFIFYEIGYRAGEEPGVIFTRGLIYGLLLFFLTFIFSTLSYKIIQRVRMHYVPKLSLVIVTVSVVVLIVILLMIYFEKNIFISVSPFIIIMMIVISEEFMSVMAKKNFIYTFSITFESLLSSVLSYAIISTPVVQKIVMDYPYVIFVIILLNVFVGKFTGLRINEYWRFREILFKENLEKNDQPQSVK
jgi:hypothetical protein